LQPGDGNAMGLYFESYFYDVAGNILAMQHRGTDPSNPGWTRSYAYLEPSLIEAGKVNNRLSSTQVGQSPLERYSYDAHGSMPAMPHLPLMEWTFLDQLRASSTQVVNNGKPETTYYVYDAAGQRVRKVTERQATEDETPTRMKERIYLGGFEIYREYGGDGVAISLQRETLHVMDDKQRIALVETRTLGDDDTDAQLTRYQLNNHLGSASVELDEIGKVISYEEYFPYGSTSYQAVDSSIKAAAKRYRYTGKERDEETGLAYHGARYYAGWLGRWTSIDPAGLRESPNLYEFVLNNPARLTDSSGLGTDSTQTWSDYFASYLSPEAWRQSLNQTAHDLVPMMPAWDALDTTIGGGYVDPGAKLQATFDSTWNNITTAMQFTGAGLSSGDVGIADALAHRPLIGEYLPKLSTSVPTATERVSAAAEQLTVSTERYTGPTTVGFWDEGYSLTASSKSVDMRITIPTVGKIQK
jgi:RHS repeat-associated protein